MYNRSYWKRLPRCDNLLAQDGTYAIIVKGWGDFASNKLRVFWIQYNMLNLDLKPSDVSSFSVIQMIHADSTGLPKFYGTQVWMDILNGTVRSDDCELNCFRGPCLVDMENFRRLPSTWFVMWFILCCSIPISRRSRMFQIPEEYPGDRLYLTAGILSWRLYINDQCHQPMMLKPQFFPRQSCTLEEL